MFSPSIRYSQAPGLRLRPVRELGVCVVFAAEEARLYRLNAQAWLVLALCREGLSGPALQAAWREAVAPEDAALEGRPAECLQQAVELLLARRLLRQDGVASQEALAEAGGGDG
ncbi:hypothetical protein JYK14_00530 [Siccirubricoccus sp. KC 17139]|uniref:PqqD family protein n=1 Tax=Siccirubricoccus soli TaxID=2899147 RepID=A0ABT1CYC7_9PROT|nr:hypothetical protein [Siccirubricoccus soli]MCO6414666.1 hypothetical protein [Siccirubricoccus soli]MCP2680796.1 hypothetical protein [Siccirubricoccus soli]